MTPAIRPTFSWGGLEEPVTALAVGAGGGAGGYLGRLVSPFRARMDQTLQRRIGTAVATFGRYVGKNYDRA